jgi:zinc transport system substrate-binding protein
MEEMVRTPRRVRLQASLALVVGVTISCAYLGGSPPRAFAAPGKQQVVAAFYPVAFAAARVGGRHVQVTNVTPVGAEPHDLELTPDLRDRIDDADVVFVMGDGFQPAIEDAAAQRDGPTVSVLAELPGGSGARDPHVWLDPGLMRDVTNVIEAALVRGDRAHADEYRANAERLDEQLAALDAQYRAGLAHCTRDVIVTSHEAFGHLASAYGLRQLGVAGLAPDAEPDAERLGDLADLVEREGVTTIFTEELVSPRIADTLARETGARTVVLSPLEGLTQEQERAGATYFTIMESNLRKLERALGCS